VHVARYDAKTSTGSVRSDQIVDHLSFRREWLTKRLGVDPDHLLLVEAEGDSMSPTFENHDLLLVDMRDARFRQDGIYLLREGRDIAVNRVQRKGDDGLLIRSDNPAYEPRTIARNAIRVLGRVVWRGGRL